MIDLLIAKGGSHITLSQVATILGLAAVAGTAISIFLQKGLRDALQTSRDNVDVLLKGREIDKGAWVQKEASYQTQIATLTGQVSVLQSDVLEGIVNAVTSASATAAATAVRDALYRDPDSRQRMGDPKKAPARKRTTK